MKDYEPERQPSIEISTQASADQHWQPLRVEQHGARCERAPVERLPMLICRRLC